MIEFDVTRDGWGARSAKRQRSAPDSYTHIEVHHTASPTQARFAKAGAIVIMRQIQNGHMFSNGWNDIFYNGFVMPDGKIYEGRPDTPNGAFRLCFLGNFEGVDTVTPEQEATLRRVARLYDEPLDTHTWRAAGTKYASACPGDDMIELVEAINENNEEEPTMNESDAIDAVTEAYEQILGRFPDQGGLDYWVGRVVEGLSITSVQVAFLLVNTAAVRAEIAAMRELLDSRSDLGLDTTAVTDAAREVFYAELRALAASGS